MRHTPWTAIGLCNTKVRAVVQWRYNMYLYHVTAEEARYDKVHRDTLRDSIEANVEAEVT